MCGLILLITRVTAVLLGLVVAGTFALRQTAHAAHLEEVPAGRGAPPLRHHPEAIAHARLHAARVAHDPGPETRTETQPGHEPGHEPGTASGRLGGEAAGERR